MRKQNTIQKTGRETPVVEQGAKIAPFAGRPFRAGIISADDVVNLRIALNTCRSLEEFFDKT